MERLKKNLAKLALQPPSVLLLEGGTEDARLELALYWSQTLNCPHALNQLKANQPAVPCGNCPVCLQINAKEHLNLWLFDGRISNREDDEKSGIVKALRIENVRELKSVIGIKPHGEGKRVVILQGLYKTREEALNSLLKTLEEPGDFTLFVLLTPQREQILPTLVSRSFCLTLPWPNSNSLDGGEWENKLAVFFTNGQGFLDEISAKGAIDSTIGSQILLCFQRSFVHVISSKIKTSLDKALQPLAEDITNSILVNHWLSEAQEMLQLGVAPGRVLEAFCSNLYLLLRKKSME